MKPGSMAYRVEEEDGSRYCLKVEKVNSGTEYWGKYWYFDTLNFFPYQPEPNLSFIDEDGGTKVLLLAPPELTTWSK